MRSYPDSVHRTNEDAREREENAQHTCLFGLGMVRGFWLVVGYDEDAETHWGKSIGGVARNGFLVEENVDEGDHGGKENAGDLVEGNRRVGQREVLEDDVEAHAGHEW